MRSKLFVILIILSSYNAFAQTIQLKHAVDFVWQGVQLTYDQGNTPKTILKVDNCYLDHSRNFLPVYHLLLPVDENIAIESVVLENTADTIMTWENIKSLSVIPQASDNYEIDASLVKIARKNYASIHIIPLKIDAAGLRTLLSANVRLNLKHQDVLRSFSELYTENSVLSTGKWYKVKVAERGMYKVTYENLKAMGVDMSKVTPQNIRVFGNGGAMLSEKTDDFRYDDLPELSIKVVSANNDKFVSGDYFIFYSPGPHSVVLNSDKIFEHQQNIYSDFSYYFFNFDGIPGKRIVNKAQSSQTPDYTNETFLDFKYFEEELYNPGKSGKHWVGHKFEDRATTFTTPEFLFKNIKEDDQCRFSFNLVSWSLNGSSFALKYNGQAIASVALPGIGDHVYATTRSGKKSFSLTQESNKFDIEFYPGSETDLGWLDFIQINQRCFLEYDGGQFYFSEPLTVWPGRITRFSVNSAQTGFNIWEVTDLVDPQSVEFSQAGGKVTFTTETNILRSYMMWDNSSLKSVVFDEVVANQNLHSLRNIEMLIVTPDQFISQANKMASLHREHDNLSVAVVRLDLIYNEFSSGSQDISAIRDFCRMLYSDRNDRPLKYLLLFGDGSFDYKDRISGNSNLIPVYLADESYDGIDSYVSDDYYGKLDDGEGLNMNGGIDIGIGRFPVTTGSEADLMVEKCTDYRFNTGKVLGSWRNIITLVADDEEGNFITPTENSVIVPISEHYPQANFRKIYFDAYKQVSTPKGHRYPDVNNAINTQIKEGTILLNYSGHGGILGWADEYVTTIPEINSWRNYNKLPLFVTATCEFSRFDDPTATSAGELVLLNEKGGAIAMLTTSRLAYLHTNDDLTRDLYDSLFNITNGQGPALGDVFAYSKNCNPYDALKNFVLLGDPAMRLAYPEYKVITSKVNNQNADAFSDTISTLNIVKVEGFIADYQGNKVADFNGNIEISVYDKPQTKKTLANDPGVGVINFKSQENIIYKGTATVENGNFKSTFIIPNDIDYSYGYGKISYYAQNGISDAAGVYNKLMVGGISETEIIDTTGPVITLYIENESFRNGDFSSMNPVLIAYLSDESGINTTGTGIGHDLMATLDSNLNEAYILNNYYRSDMDSYRSGRVYYRLNDLSPGIHTLNLKAWDILNNSSEAQILFQVKEKLPVQISDLAAYPNPFLQNLNITFNQDQQDKAFEIFIDIVNMAGQTIKTLGPYEVESSAAECGPFSWDGNDFNGKQLSSGLYVIRIRIYADDNQGSASIKVVKQ